MDQVSFLSADEWYSFVVLTLIFTALCILFVFTGDVVYLALQDIFIRLWYFPICYLVPFGPPISPKGSLKFNLSLPVLSDDR